jgi:hypothetical protein
MFGCRTKRIRRFSACALPLAVLLGVPGSGAPGLAAQQVADTAYTPPIPDPEFASGQGPLVLIDEAHNNFHTADGRYQAFARLLRRDGYVVAPNTRPFTAAALARADVLVIANALAEKDADAGDWRLPTPSAFTQAEIDAVEEWVRRGGSLLLIADHMPIPGAAEALAAAFGLRFHNGFTRDTIAGMGWGTFRRSDGSLRSHPIVDGRTLAERVDSVMTFTGQAFRADEAVSAEPLIVLPENWILLMPEVAWEFSEATPRIPAANLLQGAALEHGEGRVVAFGEAAMFSAQVSGAERAPMGMNVPGAGQNYRLVLNVLHWLTGRLD